MSPVGIWLEFITSCQKSKSLSIRGYIIKTWSIHIFLNLDCKIINCVILNRLGSNDLMNVTKERTNNSPYLFIYLFVEYKIWIHQEWFDKFTKKGSKTSFKFPHLDKKFSHQNISLYQLNLILFCTEFQNNA